MNRVKIEFPQVEPLFVTSVNVRISDINYGNHLGNDSLLSIVHEARVAWLVANGLSELNVGDNTGMIMADCMIAYKNEAFYGDVLTIALFATEITTYTYDLLYRITTLRNGQEIPVAYAKTGMICFNYANRTKALIPNSLKQLFNPQ
ncbi:MAG: thioesterase [Chitinophagia bacterium]|nr:thioesterase [Chitinophagia bacterium]